MIKKDEYITPKIASALQKIYTDWKVEYKFNIDKEQGHSWNSIEFS